MFLLLIHPEIGFSKKKKSEDRHLGETICSLIFMIIFYNILYYDSCIENIKVLIEIDALSATLAKSAAK